MTPKKIFMMSLMLLNNIGTVSLLKKVEAGNNSKDGKPLWSQEFSLQAKEIPQIIYLMPSIVQKEFHLKRIHPE